MSEGVIHIPTGKLINKQEDGEFACLHGQSEKSVLEIASPDGRTIFLVQKIIEDTAEIDEDNSWT